MGSCDYRMKKRGLLLLISTVIPMLLLMLKSALTLMGRVMVLVMLVADALVVVMVVGELVAVVVLVAIAVVVLLAMIVTMPMVFDGMACAAAVGALCQSWWLRWRCVPWWCL